MFAIFLLQDTKTETSGLKSLKLSCRDIPMWSYNKSILLFIAVYFYVFS